MKYFWIVAMIILVCSFVAAKEADDDLEAPTFYLETDMAEGDTQDAKDTADEGDDSAEDDMLDSETESEIEVIVSSNLGAVLRIFQLQKAVLKSRITADAVITVLSAKDENVTALEDLFEAIEVLEQEVLALDSASETAVADFVKIKKEIITINQEFRKIAAQMISGQDRREIAEMVAKNEEIALINEEIRSANNRLNAERVRNALKKMNIEDEELVVDVDSGKLNPLQIRVRIKNSYSSLSSDEKRTAAKSIGAAVREKAHRIENAAIKVRQNIRAANQATAKQIQERAVSDRQIKQNLETAKEIREQMKSAQQKRAAAIRAQVPTPTSAGSSNDAPPGGNRG
jgi:hypothetical protein